MSVRRRDLMGVEGDRMLYRRASVDDVESLVDCRVRFLKELYGHPEDEETEILRASLRDYFREAVPSGRFIAWLAESNGRIVGTSGMVIWQMPGRYGGLESGRLGYILNMYTVPEARRRGICTQLLKELIREAKALGIKYLHLHASEDGLSIYRKAGFAEPNQVELRLIVK